MKYLAVVVFAAVIITVAITWGITNDLSKVQTRARDIIGVYYGVQGVKQALPEPEPQPKCGLSRVCPPDHYAILLKSGAANIVGPKICFEGKSIMSGVIDNVGPGLNIVVINAENATVVKSFYLNMISGDSADILKHLKQIKPGHIVLLASFDEVTTKMTDEMRDLFVGMGSSLIKTVKYRDNWVFAGRPGAADKSPFEKLAVNDQKNNIYEGWPHVVEVGGCFPKSETDGNNFL